MPQARGTQATIGWYDETVYGVDPGSPNAQKLYVSAPFGVASQENRLDSNTLSANRDRTQPVAGNLNVTGPFNMELSAQSQGTLFRHILGSNVTTGASPFTHTVNVGDLPISGTLEKDHGPAITGVGRFERFSGCRVGSAQFSFPSEGFPTASLTLTGSNSVLASAALDATYTDNGHTSFSMRDVTSLLEGGGAFGTAREIQFTVDNGLDESGYAIGGLGKRRSLPEGFATVSGTLTAFFEDAVLLNKAIASTLSSLSITLSRGSGSGSAGNEFMQFIINNLLYERTSPNIEGPSGVMATFGFKAFRVTSVSAMTVVIKNMVATI